VLKVGDDSRLDAVIFGLKLVERDVRNQVNRSTRAELKPIWQEELARKLGQRGDPFTTAMIGKGLVSGGNPPTLRAATSRRPLKGGGGLIPDVHYYLAEFGGRSSLFSRYTRRSQNGGTHAVERRTMTGLPQSIAAGRVAYPAASQVAPRMASLWVQIFVRAVYQAVEE
jgi:hypothetical protein